MKNFTPSTGPALVQYESVNANHDMFTLVILNELHSSPIFSRVFRRKNPDIKLVMSGQAAHSWLTFKLVSHWDASNLRLFRD